MSGKLKKLALWGFIIFFAIPILFAVLIVMFSGDTESASPDSNKCLIASNEDIKNIEEGLLDNSFKLTNGFVSNFSETDIDEISSVFPTFKSPRVVAASITGPESGPIVGIWGLQEFDYGWRILALNNVAREYSAHGADVTDDSASGKVRDKMLELSANTSAPACASK